MTDELMNTLNTITEILEKHAKRLEKLEESFNFEKSEITCGICISNRKSYEKRLEKLESTLKGYQFTVNRRIEKLEEK